MNNGCAANGHGIPDLQTGLFVLACFGFIGHVFALWMQPFVNAIIGDIPIERGKLASVVVATYVVAVVGMILCRLAQSNIMYESSFREGYWVIVWSVGYMVTYSLTLVVRRKPKATE